MESTRDLLEEFKQKILPETLKWAEKAEEEARKDQEEVLAKSAAAHGAAAAPSQGSLAAGTQDGALIAVIAAAIAAYRAEAEPAGDPEAFVVRHIRRIRRK